MSREDLKRPECLPETIQLVGYIDSLMRVLLADFQTDKNLSLEGKSLNIKEIVNWDMVAYYQRNILRLKRLILRDKSDS